MARAGEGGTSPRRGKRQKANETTTAVTTMEVTTTTTTMEATEAATTKATALQGTRRTRIPSEKGAALTSSSAVAKKGGKKKKTDKNTTAIPEPVMTMTMPSPTMMTTRTKNNTPISKPTAVAAAASSATTPTMTTRTPSSLQQCAWFFHKPCNSLLPVPDLCGAVGCCKAVHPICQLIWERKNNFQSEDNTLYCPDHHQIRAKSAGAVEVVAEDEAPTTAAPVPISCVWAKLGIPCQLPFLPPVQCSIHGCTEPVHHVCVIAWEMSVGHEGTPRTVCPEHHEHYLFLMQQTKLSSSVAAASAVAVAATTANNHMPPTQVFPDPPPLNAIGAASFKSPADSTLTEVPRLPPPQVPPFPDNHEIDFGNMDSWSSNDVVAEDAVPPPHVNICVDEDSTDHRDGGDSDDEGEMSGLHVIAVARRMIDDNECNQVESSEDAERIILSNVGGGECEIDDDIGEPSGGEGTVTAVIPGSPDNWVPPQPPLSFTGYVQKHDAPSEDAIDNPAGWSMYTFTATFDKKNKYMYHTTPSKARVVPMNSSGKREVNGWEFHYQNWSADEDVKRTYARDGAVYPNLRPASRAGCLDVNVFKKHGLNAARVRSDPLFFFQMLFPICNPMESGVTDDHRHPYFSNVVSFTNMYAYWKGAGSGYGNDFPPVSITELVQWTGVPIRNGALDGKQSTLKHRWNRLDPRFDSAISNSMISNSRWRQIKRYFKLSVGLLETQKGMPGYDPCVKYDYIWRCLVHNMNYVTARADLDCTIDETTWGFSGYSGEAGGRLMNKPVSKGKT